MRREKARMESLCHSCQTCQACRKRQQTWTAFDEYFRVFPVLAVDRFTVYCIAGDSSTAIVSGSKGIPSTDAPEDRTLGPMLYVS